MTLRRRSDRATLDVWPGYVDALSTLLMVITFVLLVFVLAQAFLSVSLSDKDRQLQTLNRQVAQLSDMLSLEKSRSAELAAAIASLNQRAQVTTADRDALRAQLDAARVEARGTATAAASLQTRADALAAQLSDAAAEAKAADHRMQQLQAAADAAGAATDRDTSQQAEIALLNKQLEQLRLQLSAISAELGLSKSADAAKASQIKDLTTRLNLALASKVEELRRYRSEFFGRLQEVLKGRPGITIVGDRFVFQSEVLFPVGSADMSDAGSSQIKALATTLLQIAKQIPPSLPWILRVDGHADHQTVSGNGRFASNWELSAERAINVVRFLISQGVPADHLAATAFADTQPLTPGTTPADYARDRRIELRLTDR